MDAIQSEFNCDTVESLKNQGEDKYTAFKKPSSCPKCGNAFTKLSTLKTHEGMHRAKTSTKCSQCDHKFLVWEILRDRQELTVKTSRSVVPSVTTNAQHQVI